jgi:hypothetical protein
MKKIKIKEKELRFLVKNMLREAEGVDSQAPVPTPSPSVGPPSTSAPTKAKKQAALKALRAFKEKDDLSGKIINEYDPGEMMAFFFRGVTTGKVGKEIVDFTKKVIDYINKFKPDANIVFGGEQGMLKVIKQLASAVGGSVKRNKLSKDEIKRICQEIYSATEGGITGVGTYLDNLASALGSKQFPSFKYSIEALELEINYARIATGETFFGRSKAQLVGPAGVAMGLAANMAGESDISSDAGLYVTLMGEFGNGSEKANIRNYVLEVLSGKVGYFQFVNADGEVHDITFDNIFKKFIKFAEDFVNGKSDKKDDEGNITLSIDDDDETVAEEEEGGDASEKKRKARKDQKETYSKIKGEILRAVVPRSIETLPKFEDLFDMKAFQRSIVAGMREDRRGFGNGQDFQIEISFKNEEARIERNFSPVGTHRVKIGGKMLRKAIKSRKWRSNLKEVFADALDDALIAKGTSVADLKGLRRFRLRIIVPAGFYELNESSVSRKKVFLQGKDILKIIKKL